MSAKIKAFVTLDFRTACLSLISADLGAAVEASCSCPCDGAKEVCSDFSVDVYGYIQIPSTYDKSGVDPTPPGEPAIRSIAKAAVGDFRVYFDYLRANVARLHLEHNNVADCCHNLANANISLISSSSQELEVALDGRTLKNEVDHIVSYKKNADGTTTAIVAGRGAYFGSKSMVLKSTGAPEPQKRNVADSVITLSSNERWFIYAGEPRNVPVTVEYQAKTLKEGADYRLVYSNNTNAGKASVTVIGIGLYTGRITKTFVIHPVTVKQMFGGICEGYDYRYTGKEIRPIPSGLNGCREGVDFIATYSNNVNAGVATIRLKGITKNVVGTHTMNFTIHKAYNCFIAQAKVKSVAYSKVKNAEQVAGAVVLVTKPQTKVSFTKLSGSKALSVNKSNGRVAVKKGTKKGAYTMKVKVLAVGDSNHESNSEIVTVTVKVVQGARQASEKGCGESEGGSASLASARCSQLSL